MLGHAWSFVKMSPRKEFSEIVYVTVTAVPSYFRLSTPSLELILLINRVFFRLVVFSFFSDIMSTFVNKYIDKPFLGLN